MKLQPFPVFLTCVPCDGFLDILKISLPYWKAIVQRSYPNSEFVRDTTEQGWEPNTEPGRVTWKQ